MLEKIKEKIKDWWFSRDSIFNFYFSISSSGIFINFTILDYGIDLDITIPCILPSFYIKTFYEKEQEIFTNKFWSEQFIFVSDLRTEFGIGWFVNQDHAGFSTQASILGFNYSYELRDTRHWDYFKNCWKSYSEDK